jgi:hypothetical protein
MGSDFRRVSGLVLLLLAGVMPAAAETTHPQAVLTLPAVGAFRGGGDFEGTISINRFEQRENQVVAIGFVAGVLTRGNHKIGTGVTGEKEWPVAIRSGGIVIARGHASGTVKPSLIAFSPGTRSAGRYVLAQAASCPVLDVALGPINVNLLGFEVALGAVALNIGGEMGTPLGDLVCSASDLLGRVAEVVNLLNSLLGLITGLLGGLLGGLGGAVPI